MQINKVIPSTRILGVRVDLVDLPQSLSIIENYIRSGKPHQIVVVNVAKVVKAIKDKRLWDIIENADLCGADGVPIIWISKFRKNKIPGRVNGTDLMENLIERAAIKGYRIFFLGSKDEIIRDVIKKYKNKYPALLIAGFRNGYFSPTEEQGIIAEITNSNPDILFVGFSTPQKEEFIARYKDLMKVPIIHGVGGSFDIVAGEKKRAPIWMQKSGLEWFYRFLQEPARMWKRYLITNSLFLIYLLLEISGLKKFRN